MSSHVRIIKAHFVVSDRNMRMCSKDNFSIHNWNKLSDGEPKPYSTHSQFVSILNIMNNYTQCRLQHLSSNCRWTLKLTNMFGWIRRHPLKWPPEATPVLRHLRPLYKLIPICIGGNSLPSHTNKWQRFNNLIHLELWHHHHIMETCSAIFSLCEGIHRPAMIFTNCK